MAETIVPALWRASDVAQYLAISRPAVYKYIARGDIKSVKIANSVRVPREEVLRVAREGLSA